jgi:formate hydrogenlyase subunit 6/NADH:ubiquinone oxidoreductase subunit I
MIPWKKNLKIPEINNEICVGCGACEYACPTKPYKAIFVEGNPIHLIAKKAESKQTEQIFSPEEDFPF